MLPELEQERAILNVEKVLDGRIAVVCIQPPVINLQPCGRPIGVKNLPKKHEKGCVVIRAHGGPLRKTKVWDM